MGVVIVVVVVHESKHHECRQITKGFGVHNVVEHISFTILLYGKRKDNSEQNKIVWAL